MELGFTVAGIITLLICLALILLRRFSVVEIIFFTSPFFDFDVFSIGGLRFSLFYIFGSVLIAKYLLMALFQYRIFSFGGLSPYFLLAFVLFSVLSFYTVLFAPGGINVVPMTTHFLEYDQYEPLVFRLSNLTSLFKLVFVVLVFFVIVAELRKHSNDMHRYVANMMLGGGIVFMSGLILQLSLFLFGPNAAVLYTQLFHADFQAGDILARVINNNSFGDFPRMYSLAGEPSFTGNLFVFLLCIQFVILFSGRISGDFGLSFRHKWLFFYMFLLGIALTGSTTAYLGLATMLFLYLLLLVFGYLPGPQLSGKVKMTIVISILFLLPLLILLVIESGSVDYLVDTHIAKVSESSGSGSVRLRTIESSYEVFLNSPFIGVGLGSHRSTSLGLFLLSNIGVFGLGSFLFFIGSLLLGNNRYLFNGLTMTSNKGIIGGLKLSIPVWVIISMIAIPYLAITFAWFWLAAALLFVNNTSYQSISLEND